MRRSGWGAATAPCAPRPAGSDRQHHRPDGAAYRHSYYPDADVRIEGETVAYVWGDRMIGIHHCPTCGCGTHWKTLGEDFGRMGVHARLLDGFDESKVEVRLFDNA